MLSLSIVQGRLSPIIAGEYQYFPINNWQQEFKLASSIGISGIEWLISDLSNPLFNQVSKTEVQNIIHSTGVSITSVSLDLFKYKTLDQFPFQTVAWVIEQLCQLSEVIDIKRVCFPVEETSRIDNPKTLDAVIAILTKICKVYRNRAFKIAIETDLSAASIYKILQIEGMESIGIVLDTGNTASNGYKLEDYFEKIPEKIYGIHIKDRILGCGPSVKLGVGSAKFLKFREYISKCKNLNDITLQAFRSNNNYIDDAINARDFVLDLLNKG